MATVSSVDGWSPKSPIDNGDDASSYWTATEDQFHGRQPPMASPTYEMATESFRSTFNIDDYLSSEDEAEMERVEGPRRPRGEAEIGLLFQDSGYGGLQLPGLYDSIPQEHRKAAPASYDDLNHDRTSWAAGYGPDLDEYYGGHYPQAATEYNTQGGTFLFDDDELPPPIFHRRDLAPGRKGTTRISALGTSSHDFPPPIAEESEEKVDFRIAVRLRKEAKARKRAEGENMVREKMNGKRKPTVHSMVGRTPMGQAV